MCARAKQSVLLLINLRDAFVDRRDADTCAHKQQKQKQTEREKIGSGQERAASEVSELSSMNQIVKIQ